MRSEDVDKPYCLFWIIETTLHAYCNAVGIDFQESMLSWRQLTDEEKKEFGEYGSPFFSKVLSTICFTPDESTTEYSDLPIQIQDAIEKALPTYHQLSQNKIIY